MRKPKVYISQRRLSRFLGLPFLKYFYFFIIAYLIIKFQPLKLIPDLLNLSTVGINNIINSILAVISSIFGIFLAVIILGYEISKSKIGKYATLSFRVNKQLQYLCRQFVAILVLALIEYSTNISSSSNNLTVAYFILLISLLLIIQIIPKSFSFLNNLFNPSFVNEEIDKIQDFNYRKNEEDNSPEEIQNVLNIAINDLKSRKRDSHPHNN